MSRREEKRKAYANILNPHKAKKDTSSPQQSANVCGTCEHYSESSYSSDGRGSCTYLKLGSDISVTPPVYVIEGKEGYLTRTLSSADNCDHYQKMKMIDKDGYECSDPKYRRSIRQFQE